MDRVIFQFQSGVYNRYDIADFSRELCEHLCNVDDENVTKFDLNTNSLEQLLNDNLLDCDKCYFRCF